MSGRRLALQRTRKRAWPLRRRSLVSLAFATVLLAAGVPWSAGLVQFANSIPDRVDDPETHTDAIVVLTGGTERVATGVRLLEEQMAKRVFISGVHPGVATSEVVRRAGSEAGVLEPRIDSGYGALNTAGNATETAQWMRRLGFRSLRLVTGSYHMPRSLLEFSYALPDAVVIPHPVFPESVKQTGWWMRPGTALLIISEYNKFLFAWMHHRVADFLSRAVTIATSR